MKTLKKTLCLVLAMVMVFGLCAVSASAKLEYTDNDDIEYKEAVDVLSGIGILQGDERGFRPTDSITRAEAAKIVAYIMIGNATQADALKAGSDPFTDVPASYWAAGYIAYCANAGIVGGRGDGTFDPYAKVTGLEFAKMLLCALGYGAKDEYTGSDWVISTSKDAIRLGVFDDNLAGATDVAATREECALYAFNVIARLRDGQMGLKKVSYSALAGDYVANGAFSNSGSGSSVDANKKGTFAEDFGLDTKTAGEDDFERPVGHKWVQKLNGVTKTITADYPDDGKQMTKFTTKVTGADMYDLFGSDAKKLTATATTPDDDDRLHVYVDGAPVAANALPATFVKGDDTKIDKTGNGVETYVYSWYDRNEELNVRICIIETWMVKVSDVTEATSKKDATVAVDLLGQDAKMVGLADGATFTTDKFEKDEYVLVTATVTGSDAGAKIQSMVPATVIEDKITRYSANEKGQGKSIVVNGTTYTAAANDVKPNENSANSAKASDLDKEIVDGKEHKVYVDKYGYAIGVDEIKASSSYVFVSHFGPKTDVSGDFDKGSVAAKVYYADGTSAIVTVSKVDTKKVAWTDAKGVVDVEDKNTTYSAATSGLFKLVMSSGKAELTSGTAAAVNGTPANTELKQGRPSTVGLTDATADGDTVFFYVSGAADPKAVTDAEWEDITVAAYTGIKNIPLNKDGDCKTVAGIKDSAKAAAVLVKDSGNGESTDTVYIYTGALETEETVAMYATYVNGAEKTLEVTYDDAAKKDAGVVEFAGKKGVFIIMKGTTPTAVTPGTKEYEGSKYYDALVQGTAGAGQTQLGTLNKNEIAANDGSWGYAFANDVKVIDITGNGEDDAINTVSKLADAFAGAKKDTLVIAIQVKGEQVVAAYVTAYTPV